MSSEKSNERDDVKIPNLEPKSETPVGSGSDGFDKVSINQWTSKSMDPKLLNKRG